MVNIVKFQDFRFNWATLCSSMEPSEVNPCFFTSPDSIWVLLRLPSSELKNGKSFWQLTAVDWRVVPGQDPHRGERTHIILQGVPADDPDSDWLHEPDSAPTQIDLFTSPDALTFLNELVPRIDVLYTLRPDVVCLVQLARVINPSRAAGALICCEVYNQ